MILFIYVVVMSFSFFMAYFVKDISTIVNHKLVLDSMSFLLSRIVCIITSLLIYGSWYLLFSGINKRDKPWETLFNFIDCSKPFCDVVYLLWNWYTLSHQTFNLLYVSTANVTLVQIKEKAS